jgi:predicted nucleic acid-binding Zn ribbon protein
MNRYPVRDLIPWVERQIEGLRRALPDPWAAEQIAKHEALLAELRTKDPELLVEIRLKVGS